MWAIATVTLSVFFLCVIVARHHGQCKTAEPGLIDLCQFGSGVVWAKGYKIGATWQILLNNLFSMAKLAVATTTVATYLNRQNFILAWLLFIIEVLFTKKQHWLSVVAKLLTCLCYWSTGSVQWYSSVFMFLACWKKITWKWGLLLESGKKYSLNLCTHCAVMA